MTTRTIDEFRKRPEAVDTRAEKARTQSQNLKMVSQAAIKAELLTGHPGWDAYLTYLQAFVEQTEVLKVGFERKLADPMLVEHADLLRAKLSLAECNAMIAALSAAMELPKDIIENGAKAKDMIARMKPAGEDEAA